MRHPDEVSKRRAGPSCIDSSVEMVTAREFLTTDDRPLKVCPEVIVVSDGSLAGTAAQYISTKSIDQRTWLTTCGITR